MSRRGALAASLAVAALGTAGCDALEQPIGVVRHQIGGPFQEQFAISECALSTTGRNPYFILEPGYQLVLEGGGTKLEITVLNDTREVDGVRTRVVEEREWKRGQLYEVSRNFFAICPQTKDVFYFGEEVDFYRDGKLIGHEGAWLAGKNGARAGLYVPGTAKVGMRYYQEVAPGIAMDRAEIVSLDETVATPAGTFGKVLKSREGTALNIWEIEYKFFAPEVGLIHEGELRLTRHGFVAKS
jgi:hypothetical protein